MLLLGCLTTVSRWHFLCPNWDLSSMTTSRQTSRGNCRGERTTRTVSPNTRNNRVKHLVQQSLLLGTHLWIRSERSGHWQRFSTRAFGSAHAARQYHFWLFTFTAQTKLYRQYFWILSRFPWSGIGSSFFLKIKIKIAINKTVNGMSHFHALVFQQISSLTSNYHNT